MALFTALANATTQADGMYPTSKRPAVPPQKDDNGESDGGTVVLAVALSMFVVLFFAGAFIAYKKRIRDFKNDRQEIRDLAKAHKAHLEQKEQLDEEQEMEERRRNKGDRARVTFTLTDIATAKNREDEDMRHGDLGDLSNFTLDMTSPRENMNHMRVRHEDVTRVQSARLTHGQITRL